MKKVVAMRSAKSAGSSDETQEAQATKAAPAVNRTPWNGGLDDEEFKREGGLLLAALIQCANTRRQQMNEMAHELGVTYGYINQLRHGIRKTSQISDDFAAACAAYLGIPRLTVLLMAGRIKMEDAYESPQALAAGIPAAFEYVCKDPTWGPFVTPEVRTGTPQTQFMVIRMFEAATGLKILPEALSLTNLVPELTRLQEMREAQRASTENYRDRNVAKKRSNEVS